MTSAESNRNKEQLPPGVVDVLNAMPDELHQQIDDCIKYLRDHPEPDGVTIFDIPIYPAMWRSMKCSGYAITYRMQNRQALIYAVVADGET